MNSIQLIWFSPMYHTREIVRAFGASLARSLDSLPIEKHDISVNTKEMIFTDQDIVVIGAPVYAGRIPLLAAQRIQQIKGSNSAAIILASYGNRAYEDALLELRDLTVSVNLIPVAAAACIARHTIADVYAQGRPNSEDLNGLSDFAAKVGGLLKQNTIDNTHLVKVPGNKPYKTAQSFPLPQSVDDNCVLCGICWKKCPASAIKPGVPNEIDLKKCICCMRCVNVCPESARHPDPAFINNITQKLAPVCSTPKQNEYFMVKN